MIPIRHFLVATLVILATATILPARTWKEAGSDRTFDCDFVKLDGETVVIRRGDGSVISVPLSKFSDEDQEFAKSQPGPAPMGTLGTTGESAGASSTTMATLTGVHLCCDGCEKGVNEALAGIADLKIGIDRGGKSVTLIGPNIQQAALALLEKGYFGESDSGEIEIPENKASETKKSSVEVSGVHLCCKACVTAVNRALGYVEGFESHTATPDATSFTVNGDGITAFNVLKELRRAGLNGTVK